MSLPYTRFFWGDWRAATAHLDLLQRGAYMALLEYIYQFEKPLPGDQQKIYRICHATNPTEQNAINEMLTEFFVPFEDPEYGLVFRNLRAEQEIEQARQSLDAKHDRAKKAAAARWGNASSNAQAMHKQSSSNANQNQNQIKDLVDSKESTRPKTPRVSGRVPYQEILNLWKTILPELPQPHSPDYWTAARKAKIRARWANELPDLEAWEQLFRDIRESDFLMGKTGKWRCDLFWVTKPENLLKISERKYHA